MVTIHPAAVRAAEMLMHPEHPMLSQAALDYVRDELECEAAEAYEQIRHALADWLEDEREKRDRRRGSDLHIKVAYGYWGHATDYAMTDLKRRRDGNIQDHWNSWLGMALQICTIGEQLQSLIPVEVSQ